MIRKFVGTTGMILMTAASTVQEMTRPAEDVKAIELPSTASKSPHDACRAEVQKQAEIWQRQRPEVPLHTAVEQFYERRTKQEEGREMADSSPLRTTEQVVHPPPDLTNQVEAIGAKYMTQQENLRRDRVNELATQAKVDDDRITKLSERLGVNFNAEGRKNLEAAKEANAAAITKKYDKADAELKEKRDAELAKVLRLPPPDERPR